MRAELVSYRDLASGVRHFVFESAEIDGAAFQPGQFVSFLRRSAKSALRGPIRLSVRRLWIIGLNCA